MARAKFIGIRETLTSLLPRAELEHLAYESGMVQRRHKVDPNAVLWALVLVYATGRERTLVGLRRMYQRATGTSLVPSAFYDRFTAEGSIVPCNDSLLDKSRLRATYPYSLCITLAP